MWETYYAAGKFCLTLSWATDNHGNNNTSNDNNDNCDKSSKVIVSVFSVNFSNRMAYLKSQT